MASLLSSTLSQTASGLVFKIFEAPDSNANFEPLRLLKKIKGRHSDTISGLEWSPDSRFVVTWSRDLTVQMHNVFRIACKRQGKEQVPEEANDEQKQGETFQPFVFSTHKEVVRCCFFAPDMKYFYTLDRSSVLCVWKWVDDYVSEDFKRYRAYEKFKKGKKIKLEGGREKLLLPTQDAEEDEQALYSSFEKAVAGTGRFILLRKDKFFLKTFTRVKVAYFRDGLLVIGYQNGSYFLKRIDGESVTEVQSFQLTNHKISALAINASGAWIGIGLRDAGQLLVWEWRSQSYVLNQQCLTHDVACCAFSIDGGVIATGGFDSKVRLWDAKSYLCFATLTEHEGKITGLQFTSRANTVVSCSLDGTVRCHDTLRYRCFRTLKPDLPTQFTSLAVDSAGELVCAGGIDPYDIYVWNVQTGNLLEVITGHEGPISCLEFSQIENILFSGSWDKNVRVHDIFARKLNADVLNHNSEITALCARNDGRQLCVATLKGELYFWDVKNAQIISHLECKRDLKGGRLSTDRVSAKNSQSNKYFTSVQYSADGEHLLAGGNSKNLCLYELRHKVLLRKFVLTNNRSLDGVLEQLNSKNLKDNVLAHEINDHSDSEYEERKDNELPGSKTFDKSKRKLKRRVEARAIRFSPSEDSWIVATSEGLMVYGSRALSALFSPYELDENVSTRDIVAALAQQNYPRALSLALTFNDSNLLARVYDSIPENTVASLAKTVPKHFLEQLLRFIAQQLLRDTRVELHFVWLQSLMFVFAEELRNVAEQAEFAGVLKAVLKGLNQRFEQVNTVADANVYQLTYAVNNLKLLQQGESI